MVTYVYVMLCYVAIHRDKIAQATDLHLPVHHPALVIKVDRRTKVQVVCHSDILLSATHFSRSIWNHAIRVEGAYFLNLEHVRRFTTVGAKELVHWFLEGKGLGIQQGMSVWVGSPKSLTTWLVSGT